MTLNTLQNFYKATVSTAWAAGTGNRYVSVLPTPSSGLLVVNPSDISKREIVRYSATGTDAGGTYITISTRGIGGTTDQTHDVNEPVRMNLTAEHYSDIQTELDLKLDDSQLDTDGTLAANSDTKIASQKAVKTYADAITSNVTTLNAQNVKLTGDQTITSGIKTFVVSPIVPTPTTSTQAASKGYVDGVSIAGAPDSSTTTKGIGRVSVAPASPTIPIFVGDNDPRLPTQAEKDALAGTGGTPSGTNPYVTKSSLKFGGTGTDGALTLTSGATNIDLGGAAYFEKNYTSISITGTGQLTFTNPHANGTIIKLRSQGNVTLTSSATPNIECSGLGGSTTTGTTVATSVIYTDKGRGYFNTGAPGVAVTSGQNTAGQNGSNIGGFAVSIYSRSTTTWTVNREFATALPPINQKDPIYPGGGGSTGVDYSSGNSGAGGSGGGALDIECNGALNFTGTIWAKGNSGSTSGVNTGGHGAGGTVRLLYTTLTSASGTISVTSSGNAGQSLVAQNITI